MAICSCGLPAHCRQSAVAGSLFMQISVVSLALTWPHRFCLLSVHLCGSHCYNLSTFQAHWGSDTAPAFSGLRVYLQFTWEVCLPHFSCRVFFPLPFYKLFCSWLLGVCCCSCKPVCLFTAHVGNGSSPLSCGVFLPLPLSQAFPLLVSGCTLLLPPSLARPGLFIYSSVRDSSPSPFSTQGVPSSLLHVFMVLIAYYSVSLFFPGWLSVCPGGYADLAQGCLWEYCILLSSPCGPHWAWVLALARGMEGSKFCLFSVALSARCVSSISPRFQFRRHSFCFLPLAAILESSQSLSICKNIPVLLN
jgi:hypothetical protein